VRSSCGAGTSDFIEGNAERGVRKKCCGVTFSLLRQNSPQNTVTGDTGDVGLKEHFMANVSDAGM
jgi:hypothetical protein